jgi:serine phosphatase RsbU (regulator of sigma subunit)
MSIMGNNFLNGGILLGHTTPKALLVHLDSRVCEIFHSSGNSTDGMDIGLCLIDRRTQTITYCGAKRPLTVIGESGVQIVEGARRSIGQGRLLGCSVPFAETVLPLDPTASYFLYSDGLQDQFGGPKSRKLGHRQLLQWLTELAAAPLTAATATELRRRITAWQGREEQTDDMCLMGFRAC